MTNPSQPETLESVHEEYLQLCHAMQSGVATMMGVDGGGKETTPKHLRVGINSAQVGIAATARILIAKGIITELEYYQAQREEMRKEVQSYEEKCSAAHGVRVTLA